MTIRASRWLLAALAAWAAGTPVRTAFVDPLVFVSRQIQPGGSIYWDRAMDLPGVGPHSRFRPAAPGRLLVREPGGSIRTLIDGAHPTAASFHLIDVDAPDVSYDGGTIVFAGLPDGVYPQEPAANPGGWRLFIINSDGTGLRQLTRSDQQLDLTQFGDARGGLRTYDDTDPAWLPDGRVVFSSTRWPSYAHYSGVRTTNLFVVNADGSGLHRITSERNGADRPQVDPITGRIVYARWWRNHRFALDDTRAVADPAGGFFQKDGLSARRELELDGRSQFADYLWRNVWNAATINPDGTDVRAWGGAFLQTGDGSPGHVYGGSFTASGDLLGNFFPMLNMTEASGFGGVRRYRRGPEPYDAIVGVTEFTGRRYVHPSAPTSFGIFEGDYAAEPVELSDGSLVVSWASDVRQDYGLYRVSPSGGERQLLFDGIGTSELRARPLIARRVPPIVRDSISRTASPLPPGESAPYDISGTFTFDALNVYANAPVDTDIVNAPGIGSAATIRFFLDHQRTSPGSFPNLDWPILLEEKRIGPDGAVRTTAPADLPLFEQLRTVSGTVPLTRGPAGPFGAGHVAGMNFGRPGATARCVGCHIGHTMIAVPATAEEARWTNLAPGADVTVSSAANPAAVPHLVDRRARKAPVDEVWTSRFGSSGEWIQLTFPVPVLVRTVRVYAPAIAGAQADPYEITSVDVRLFVEPQRGGVAAAARSTPLRPDGTDVNFHDVRARAVRIDIGPVRGTIFGARVAAVSEVEVVAAGVGP